MAVATVAEVDSMIARLNSAYRRVVDAQGSAVKLPSAELNLLSILGWLRDAMAGILRSGSREALQEIFGGSCTRVAHIRAVVDALTLSPMNASDQRLRGCLNACASVKEVLVDMGLSETLEKAEEEEKRALEEGPAAADGEGEAGGSPASAAEPEAGAAAAEEASPGKEPAASELEAGLDVRPALAAVVEEEWAELMGVAVCKVGCGRRVAPGVTRSGKSFDTCCRGCALGRPHHKLCGLINPEKVGEGLCKNGCGRRAAEGTDTLGLKRDTCCRGCANGGSHDEWCSTAGAEDGTKKSVVVVRDERAFFTEVKSRLSMVQFNRFLEICRLLNRGRQTPEETLAIASTIFGEEAADLTVDFERLLRARLREKGRR